jgi:hypothetical protein
MTLNESCSRRRTLGRPGNGQSEGGTCRRWVGIFVRKERWCLSWKGRLLALLIAMSSLLAVQYTIYPFLATTRRVTTKVLVVEGWLSIEDSRQAVMEFRHGNYKKVLTTGCLAAKDDWGDELKVSYADWGAANLRKLGISRELIQPVPCWIERKDRTYHSALALKEWCAKEGVNVKAMNIVTRGPHARRTRLLFRKAFGLNVQIGIIAVEPKDYDPRQWWRSSEGVRDVAGEMLAYVYARLFFVPGGSEERLLEERKTVTNRAHFAR